MSDHSITSLIEKLEGAETGSRSLDASMWGLMEGGVTQAEVYTEYTEQGPREAIVCELGTRWADDVAPVTTSLDAALALAERVLPGWRMHALQDQQGIYQTDNTATRWAAGISEMRGPGNVLSYAPTPALAVCASILKARAQSEAADGSK